MAPSTGKGRAWEITQIHLGGPAFEQSSNVSVGTSLVSVVKGNGDRVGLIMLNNGATDVFIGLDSATSTSNGIRLSAAGGSASLNVKDDFTLPSREWLGISSAPANNVYVLEIIALGVEQQTPQGF